LVVANGKMMFNASAIEGNFNRQSDNNIANGDVWIGKFFDEKTEKFLDFFSNISCSTR